MDATTAEHLRATLKDRDSCMKCARYFVSKSCAESHIDDESFVRICERQVVSGIKTVYKYSESPIETMFVNSLMLWAAKNSPIAIQIFAPTDDVEDAIENFRRNNRLAFEWYGLYKELPDDVRPRNFEHLMQFVQQTSPGMTDEDRSRICDAAVLGLDLGFFNIYHVIMQAAFPHVRVNGRSIRVDLVVFVPGNDRVKVVVECDGYDFHVDKTTFTSDRQRDRALASKGYAVRRYSGSEIHADPVAAAADLADYLWDSYPINRRSSLPPENAEDAAEFIEWLRAKRREGKRPCPSWVWREAASRPC